MGHRISSYVQSVSKKYKIARSALLRCVAGKLGERWDIGPVRFALIGFRGERMEERGAGADNEKMSHFCLRQRVQAIILRGALLLTSLENTTSPTSSIPSILGLVTTDSGLLASIDRLASTLCSITSLSRSLSRSRSRSRNSLSLSHSLPAVLRKWSVDGPGPPGGPKWGKEGIGGGKVGLAGEALGGRPRESMGGPDPGPGSRGRPEGVEGEDERRRLVGVGFMFMSWRG